MAADVYFASLSASKKSEALLRRLDGLCERLDLGGIAGEGDLTAVKLHFGEEGNTAFLRPIYVGRIVDRLLEAGCNPFLVDANTLYKGSRSNAVDHLNVAARHGFVPPVVNAPIVIGDGLVGKDCVDVEIDGKHFGSVKVASAAYHAAGIVGIAHFKGHMVTGFGGAIKNIGMGLGSRAGKQQMHSTVKPVAGEKCQGCGTCALWCPAGAITISDGRAIIDHGKCIGCGECTATCPHWAIEINWDGESRDVMERMCEYALGVLKGKEGRCAFINFVIDITPNCDCLSWSDEPIAPDIGVMASRDIVAIDQASVDKVLEAAGDVFAKRHNVDWSSQLRYGEEIGLGTREYRLIDL